MKTMAAYLLVALLAYMCGHSHGAKRAGRNILDHATRMGKFVIGNKVVVVAEIRHDSGMRLLQPPRNPGTNINVKPEGTKPKPPPPPPRRP